MQPKCSTNKWDYGHLVEYYAVIKNGDVDPEQPKQPWKINTKLEDSYFLILKLTTKLW